MSRASRPTAASRLPPLSRGGRSLIGMVTWCALPVVTIPDSDWPRPWVVALWAASPSNVISPGSATTIGSSDSLSLHRVACLT